MFWANAHGADISQCKYGFVRGTETLNVAVKAVDEKILRNAKNKPLLKRRLRASHTRVETKLESTQLRDVIVNKRCDGKAERTLKQNRSCGGCTKVLVKLSDRSRWPHPIQ